MNSKKQAERTKDFTHTIALKQSNCCMILLNIRNHSPNDPAS